MSPKALVKEFSLFPRGHMLLGLVIPGAFLHQMGDPGKNGQAHRKDPASFSSQPLEKLGESEHQQDPGHMRLDSITGGWERCGRGRCEHSRHLRHREPARKGGGPSPLNSHGFLSPLNGHYLQCSPQEPEEETSK